MSGAQRILPPACREALAELGRLIEGTVHVAKTNGIYGRRGMPVEMREVIIADYGRLKSIRKVAALHGRTNQAIHEFLRRHHVTLGARWWAKPEVVTYRGERFSPDKDGYFRSTSFSSRAFGGHRLLHRVVWENEKGPIPKDEVVYFADGDRANCAIANLRCCSRKHYRQVVKVWTGNGWTKFWEKKEALHAEIAAAESAGDMAALQAARARLRELRPPFVSDETLRRRSEFFKAMWAERSPAERKAVLDHVARAPKFFRPEGTGPKKHRQRHRVVWELEHGQKLPRGYVVRFADGNPKNRAPENLVLWSRNEVVRESQAAALLKRSRELTGLLLKRSQKQKGEKDEREILEAIIGA